MYDFILFENFYLAYNHYKDVCLIAELLLSSGFSVAIADVFGEAEHCVVEGVPHIHFKKKCPVDINTLITCNSRCRGFLLKLMQNKLDDYLRYIMRQLKGKYHHLYVGSYFTYMTTGWLDEIPASSCAFFWGLRSSRMIERTHSATRLRLYFDAHQNFKFFVSNEIILKEFLELGFDSKRLVLRPERTIKEVFIPPKKQSSSLHLLSIGTLRPQKRIEMCLDAIKQIEDIKVDYIIAGCSSVESYNSIIKAHLEGLDNVIRLNYRIPEEEYDRLLCENDFLVLCDQQQPSSITNGTMNEALFKGMPIIAPDYNPYKYYVEKYGVGLLYNDMDVDSLVNSIREAAQKGKNCFFESIVSYQKTLLFEKVLEEFADSLRMAINN